MADLPIHAPSGRAMLMASVAALRAERDIVRLRLTYLDGQIGAMETILAADEAPPTPAHIQTSLPLASPTAAPPLKRYGPSTWPEVVEGSVRGQERGKTTADIVAEVAGTPFEAKHRDNPNGLYNTIRRLEVGGRLFRIGKRIYDPEVYDRIQAGEIAGPDADDMVVENKDSIPGLILKLLREADGPMRIADIRAELFSMPELQERLARNPDLPYTHVSKMKRRNKVIREADGRYSLPERALAPAGNVVSLPTKTGGQT